MQKVVPHLKCAGTIGLCFTSFCLGDSIVANVAIGKPNIILVLVDDQGCYAFGCCDATEAQTPRIDAMARARTRFADYYAAERTKLCSDEAIGFIEKNKASRSVDS